MKKSASMGNLSSAHYLSSSSSPNPSSPSSDPLRDPNPALAQGYVSDDPAHASCSSNCRAERKKGFSISSPLFFFLCVCMRVVSSSCFVSLLNDLDLIGS